MSSAKHAPRHERTRIRINDNLDIFSTAWLQALLDQEKDVRLELQGRQVFVLDVIFELREKGSVAAYMSSFSKLEARVCLQINHWITFCGDF